MACDGWRATDGGSYQPNPLPWLANGYSKPRGMVGVDRRYAVPMRTALLMAPSRVPFMKL